jgi:hypothetical protein
MAARQGQGACQKRFDEVITLLKEKPLGNV